MRVLVLLLVLAVGCNSGKLDSIEGEAVVIKPVEGASWTIEEASQMCSRMTRAASYAVATTVHGAEAFRCVVKDAGN